jgi:hypothetical protein
MKTDRFRRLALGERDFDSPSILFRAGEHFASKSNEALPELVN